MESIEINGISIGLDSKVSYYEIDDFYFGYPMIKVSLERLSEQKKRRVLFLGFPIMSEIENISVLDLRRLKIRGNNAMAVLHMLILKNCDYDYFFVSTAGIDPLGIAFLKKIPESFKELNKNVFIIGAVKQAIHFQVKL